MAEKFLQKGYTRALITEVVQKVGSMDRSSLVADSDKNKDKNINTKQDVFQYRIILDYNIQHKKVEKIILKYWDILKKDIILGPTLPARPICLQETTDLEGYYSP